MKDEGVKNFKRFCFWYSEANPDNQNPEIRCKYGSLCKYPHLKGSEVDLILEKGFQKVECSFCEIKKIFTLKSKDGNISLLFCPYGCHFQKRKIVDLIISKAKARDLCVCEITDDFVIYPKGTHPKIKNGEVKICKKCNGIFGSEI